MHVFDKNKDWCCFFILGLTPPQRDHFLSLFSWCPVSLGDKIVPVRTDFRRIELKSLQESFSSCSDPAVFAKTYFFLAGLE